MTANAKRFFTAGVILFAVAFAVRIVTWQTNSAAMDSVQYLVTTMYVSDAISLVTGDLKTFLAGDVPPSDATVIAHPPGYPILMAASFAVFGQDLDRFRLLQIVLCSLAPVLVFLIAAELFDGLAPAIAGALTAVAPQPAYYSGILLPDGLCVLPILVGVYAAVRAVREPRFGWAVLAGLALAISCWLRSNALLMPLFFLPPLFALLPKTLRLRWPSVFLFTFIGAIAPITIRNAIVFHSFIPLSTTSGHMLVVGLAEYDTTGELRLPATDEDETALDARRDGRPDYYGSMFKPDGVRRDRERTQVALDVIERYPAWYLSIVTRRALGMLRMERVPVISPAGGSGGGPVFRIINVPLKLIQRLFITAVVLPFCALGIWFIIRKRKSTTSAVLVLAAVPAYYMCVQSLIYTEYRFLVAVPHVLLIFAAAGIDGTGRWLSGLVRYQFGQVREPGVEQP